MEILNNLIIRSARAGVLLQKPDGSMPEGKNGPHLDVMTGARNTAHWAITFLLAYKISGYKKFSESQKKFKVLISEKFLPGKGSFYHRNEPGKNRFNGLIGQVWSLEALIFGAKILNEKFFGDIAGTVFASHPFLPDRGLWQCVDIDGTPSSIEYTLNQQIWMATIACDLEIFMPRSMKLARCFLNKLFPKFKIRSSGRIRLGISKNLSETSKALIKRSLAPFYNRFAQQEKNIFDKEIGYHVFTLCGLAKLYLNFPENSFWESGKFYRALNFILSEEFSSSIKNNPYGFPYNVVGFEIPFVFNVFRDKFANRNDVLNLAKECFVTQYTNDYNYEDNLLNSNWDPMTLQLVCTGIPIVLITNIL